MPHGSKHLTNVAADSPAISAHVQRRPWVGHATPSGPRRPLPREQQGLLAERLEGRPVRRRAGRAGSPRRRASSGSVVLKSLKFVHDPDDETFELGRVDAVSLDVLTGSAHTIDVFGHCGTTSVQEYAGGDLKRLLPKLGHVERLEMAVMIAEGVADVHSVGGGRNGTVSLIHNDVSLILFLRAWT